MTFTKSTKSPRVAQFIFHKFPVLRTACSCAARLRTLYNKSFCLTAKDGVPPRRLHRLICGRITPILQFDQKVKFPVLRTACSCAARLRTLHHKSFCLTAKVGVPPRRLHRLIYGTKKPLHFNATAFFCIISRNGSTGKLLPPLSLL